MALVASVIMALAKEKIDNSLSLLEGLDGGISSSVFEAIVMNFPDIIHSVDKTGNIVSWAHCF